MCVCVHVCVRACVHVCVCVCICTQEGKHTIFAIIPNHTVSAGSRMHDSKYNESVHLSELSKQTECPHVMRSVAM